MHKPALAKEILKLIDEASVAELELVHSILSIDSQKSSQKSSSTAHTSAESEVDMRSAINRALFTLFKQKKEELELGDKDEHKRAYRKSESRPNPELGPLAEENRHTHKITPRVSEMHRDLFNLCAEEFASKRGALEAAIELLAKQCGKLDQDDGP